MRARLMGATTVLTLAVHLGQKFLVTRCFTHVISSLLLRMSCLFSGAFFCTDLPNLKVADPFAWCVCVCVCVCSEPIFARTPVSFLPSLLEHLVSSASSAKAMLRLNLAPPEVFVVFSLLTTYSLERIQRDAPELGL
jgi:hypothetical protein